MDFSNGNPAENVTEEVVIVKEEGFSEIEEMASKLKEKLKNNTTAAAKQQAASPTNCYVNKAGQKEPMPASTPNNNKVNEPEILPGDYEYIQSIKGKFSWMKIEEYWVPYITREIDGKCLNFVSVRIAEAQVLSNYIKYFHSDMYTCISIKSHFISDSEAKLLNEINQKHAVGTYGKEIFVAGKDCIVSLDDVREFHKFLKTCYKKLLLNVALDQNEKCGFIRIDYKSVVPYCDHDGNKYVPIFYFEGETECLMPEAIKIENWSLSYLKFCCKVQGIRNELFDRDSCEMVSLDHVKSCYTEGTHFEDYWPSKVIDSELITNQNSDHVYTSGIWIRTPNGEVPAKNPIPQTLIAPAPSTPQRIPVTSTVTSAYQNGWPENQLTNPYTTQPQPQPPSTDLEYCIVTRHQSMAAQSYNAGPSTSQVISLRNNVSHVTTPPPLVCTSAVSNVSYSNVVPNVQYVTATYNSMTDNFVMPHPSQMQQMYTQCADNNSQSQRQQCQQQQIQQHPQQQQVQQHPQQQLVQQHPQQQQIQQYPRQQQVQQYPRQQQVQQRQQGMHSQIRQTYSGQLRHGRVTNTQQRRSSKRVRKAENIVPREFIDLSSPPPSPGPVQENLVVPHIGWELMRIPERSWGNEEIASNDAYKIQKAIILGKQIPCINAKPYIYSELLVTLNNLVQMLFPTCSVVRCGYILTKNLGVTLYVGNSEQLNVLQENGCLWSEYPTETPMASLQCVTSVFVQLQKLVN